MISNSQPEREGEEKTLAAAVVSEKREKEQGHAGRRKKEKVSTPARKGRGEERGASLQTAKRSLGLQGERQSFSLVRRKNRKSVVRDQRNWNGLEGVSFSREGRRKKNCSPMPKYRRQEKGKGKRKKKKKRVRDFFRTEKKPKGPRCYSLLRSTGKKKKGTNP